MREFVVTWRKLASWFIFAVLAYAWLWLGYVTFNAVVDNAQVPYLLKILLGIIVTAVSEGIVIFGVMWLLSSAEDIIDFFRGVWRFILDCVNGIEHAIEYAFRGKS